MPEQGTHLSPEHRDRLEKLAVGHQRGDWIVRRFEKETGIAITVETVYATRKRVRRRVHAREVQRSPLKIIKPDLSPEAIDRRDEEQWTAAQAAHQAAIEQQRETANFPAGAFSASTAAGRSWL